MIMARTKNHQKDSDGFLCEMKKLVIVKLLKDLLHLR